jgi:acetyl-CoA acetyltransferase
MHRKPLSSEEYINARMIAEPLCLYDFCQETDGAVAVITIGHAHGRVRYWGRAFFSWMGMPDEYFASAGNKPIADRLYERAGHQADIDVALLYYHFTPMS